MIHKDIRWLDVGERLLWHIWFSFSNIWTSFRRREAEKAEISRHGRPGTHAINISYLTPLSADPDNGDVVATYRIDTLAELARQLQFTPQDLRLAQVNAAEELLHDVDPNRAYPSEFLIFRITGYHPKKLSDELLAGRAVQHDLGLLIEQIVASRWKCGLIRSASRFCQSTTSANDSTSPAKPSNAGGGADCRPGGLSFRDGKCRASGFFLAASSGSLQRPSRSR